MSKYSLPLTRLIHENLAVIATFAFSRKSLETLVQPQFAGDWKYLSRALFDIPSQNAIKSCIELAVFLRHLDDREDLGSYLAQTKAAPLGKVFKSGAIEDLHFRDLTNKIMHASELGWDFVDPDRPKLICVSSEPKRWEKAEVDIVALAALCGEIVS